MADFSTGLSALTTAQLALDIIGQNIANAGTPGYHRQVVDLTEAQPELVNGFAIGNGVQLQQIRQLRDDLLKNAITQNTADTGGTSAQLDAMQQIQTLITPSDGSLGALLQNFFNQLTQLASQPDNMAQRQVALNDAVALAQGLNGLATSFDNLQQGLSAQLQQTVGEINRLTPQIASLNGQIQRAQAVGTNANDLIDQRDQLINQVAQDINVQTVRGGEGQPSVFVAGVPVVLGSTSMALVASTDPSGKLDLLQPTGSQQPLIVSGGKMAGLMQVSNQLLPDYRSRLDALAQTLRRTMDELRATGMGLSGGQTFLAGTRGVQDVNAPLNSASPAFPIQAGSLWIAVTNTATGQRTLSQVNIDPSTQS